MVTPKGMASPTRTVNRGQIDNLTFDHIVVFSHDRAVFACAKVNGNGHTRIFLVFDDGNGRVYSRNGRADSWEVITEGLAGDIRRRIASARNNHIPVYTLNGKSSEGSLH